MPLGYNLNKPRGRGGMVDAADLENWALMEKSIKWMLSNSGKPNSEKSDMAILSQANSWEGEYQVLSETLN